MTKGKKQHAQVISFLDGASTRVELSDGDYLACGAAIESGALDSKGNVLVQISPQSPKGGRLKMRQTALGSLAPTLLGALGLEDLVWDAVISKARPRCGVCNVLAEKSETIDPGRWPSEGYVALVVHGVDESCSLREQCELSGFDRAVVGGRLVRVEDLGDEVGEPVLRLLPAAQKADAERALEEWFDRGGVAVRLEHFLSREARGVELQQVFRLWRCPGCSQSFDSLTAQAIEESESCRRCRGEGWLLFDDDRLIACDDCDGFGRITPLSRYEFLGRPLVSVPSLSLRRVLREIKSDIPAAESRRLEILSDAGLDVYPIGTAEPLMSTGERILATLASVQVSKPHSLIVAVVGSDGESEVVSRVLDSLGPDRSKVLSPVSWIPSRFPSLTKHEEIITVRDIERGPLSLKTLTFARGALTVVQGEPGTGKTLLLSEIYERFARRKKLSHLSSFGSLRKCVMLEHVDRPSGILLDLLGLGPDFAAEVVKTRGAKERGLVEADFLTGRSKNLCAHCRGGTDASAEECPVCEGSVFDTRVGSLRIGSMSVAEIMRRPLSEAMSVFSLNDSVKAVLSTIPEDLRARLSLGSSVLSLEPGVRAFVAMVSGIGRCLAMGDSAKDTLVLMDRAFATTASFQKLILDSMVEFVERGGTILCASVPKALEKIATSVIRLDLSGEEESTLGRERFFDLRMSRRSSVTVEPKGSQDG